MADGDGAPDPGQRHAGVVRRSELSRPRPSTARRDWLALVGVATLMVIVLVVLASFFGGTPTASPSHSPTAIAAASQTPTLKPTYSAEPTATPTPSPTPSPTPPPTPAPTPTPTASPTLTPSPTPEPSPTPGPSSTPEPSPTSGPTPSTAPLPTPPLAGLIVIDPVDGATVAQSTITVRGLSQPGAQITQDIPFWFDAHTTADAAGQWSLDVALSPGWNALKFRVDDQYDTSLTLNVYLQAP